MCQRSGEYYKARQTPGRHQIWIFNGFCLIHKMESFLKELMRLLKTEQKGCVI